MGYYIQTPTVKGKANYLIENHGAKPIVQPQKFDVKKDKALIVIADNGPFEAAGFVFDEEEFLAFTEPGDPRRKNFLLMDLKKAKELSGFKD